jgi:hypothetical protein
MTFVRLLSAPTARRPLHLQKSILSMFLSNLASPTPRPPHKPTPLDALPEQKDGLPVIMGKAGGNHITDG